MNLRDFIWRVWLLVLFTGGFASCVNAQATYQWSVYYTDPVFYDPAEPDDFIPRTYAENDSGYQVVGVSSNIFNSYTGGTGNRWIFMRANGSMVGRKADSGTWENMDAEPADSTGFFIMNDYELIRSDNRGNVVWGYYFPNRSIAGIDLDAAENVWMAAGKAGDISIMQYSPAGTLMQEFSITIPSNDDVKDISVSPFGDIYVNTLVGGQTRFFHLDMAGNIIGQIQYPGWFEKVTWGPNHSAYLGTALKVMMVDSLGQPVWIRGINAWSDPSYGTPTMEIAGLATLPNQCVAIGTGYWYQGGISPSFPTSFYNYPYGRGKVNILGADGSFQFGSWGYSGGSYYDFGPIRCMALDRIGRIVAGANRGQTELFGLVYDYSDYGIEFSRIAPPKSICYAPLISNGSNNNYSLPSHIPLSATVTMGAPFTAPTTTLYPTTEVWPSSYSSCWGCIVPNPTIHAIQDSLTFTFWVAPWVSQTDTVLWNFGDGNSGQGGLVNHTYATGNQGWVTVEVRNQCGVGRDTLLLDPCNFASFSVSADTVCVNDSVALTNSSFQSIGNQWYLNGVLVSTQVNPSIALPDTGVNIIQLIANNGTCLDTLVDTVITVGPNLVPGFTFTHNLLALQLQDTSTNARDWLWDFGDGNTSTLRNPTHTYAVGGNYQICLTAADFCAPQTVCDSFNCYPPDLDWQVFARWDTIWMINLSSRYDSISWTLPNGSHSNLDTIVYVAGVSGLQTVSLEGWTACGSYTLNTSIATYLHSDTAQLLFKVVDTLNTNGILKGSREMADGAVMSVGFESQIGLGKEMHIIRRDGAGNFIWAKTIGGNLDDEAEGVAPLPDGTFLVCGRTFSVGGGGSDATVLRMNQQGNVLWQRVFGGAGADGALEIMEAASGTCVVIGYMEDSLSTQSQVWAAKLDSAGTVLWSNRVPGEGNAKGIDLDISDNGSIFILAEEVHANGLSIFCGEEPQSRMIKFDANGINQAGFYIGEEKAGDPRKFVSLAVGEGKIVLGGRLEAQFAGIITSDFDHNFPLAFPIVSVIDTGSAWFSFDCYNQGPQNPGYAVTFFSNDIANSNIKGANCDKAIPVGGMIDQVEYVGQGKFLCVGPNQVYHSNIHKNRGWFMFDFVPVNLTIPPFPSTMFSNHEFVAPLEQGDGSRNIQQLTLEKSGVIIATGNEFRNRRLQWLVKTKELDASCMFITDWKPIESNLYNYCKYPSKDENIYMGNVITSSAIDTLPINDYRTNLVWGINGQVANDRQWKPCHISCDKPLVQLTYSIANDTLRAQVQPQAGTTYFWEVNGAPVAVGANFTYHFSQCQLYLIELVAENSCGRVVQTFQHQVYQLNSFSIGPDTLLCDGDTALLQLPSGWSSPVWSTGSTAAIEPVFNPGAYSVQAMHSSGCISWDTILVQTANSIPLNIGQDTTLCNGDSLAFAVPPGFFNPVWSTGSTASNISVLQPGPISLSAIDTNGCKVVDTLSLSYFSNLNSSLPPDTNICIGNVIAIGKPLGLFNPLWSTGQNSDTIFVAANTQLWLEAVDSSGCVIVDTIEIQFFSPIPLNLGQDTTLCPAESITLSVSPGLSSQIWSTGQTTPSILVSVAGNYFVEGVDTGGCSVNDSLSISYFPQQPFSIGSDTTVCNGESLTLMIPFGFNNPVWSTGSTASNISVLQPGLVWLVATDSNGCSISDSLLLNHFPSGNLNLGPDTTLCGGTSWLLSVPIGFVSPTWGNGSTGNSLLISSSGQYSLIAINTWGCAEYDTVSVAFQTPIPLNLGPDTTLCSVSSYSLSIPIAFSNPLWSTGETTASINISSSGNYIVSAVDVNGCTSSDTINILLRQSLLQMPDRQICPGDVAVITLPSGYSSPTWSNGSNANSITILSQGIYWVQAIDTFGCQVRDTVVISYFSTGPLLISQSYPSCIGDTTHLFCQPGFNNFLWSTGETTPSIGVLSQGMYQVSATDTNGCHWVNDRFVQFYPKPVFSLGPDTVVCYGTNILFSTPSGNASYVWSTGDTSQSIQNPPAGPIVATVTSSDGCTWSDTILLAIEIPTIPSFGFSTPSSLIQFANFTPSPVDSFEWSFGDGTFNKVDWSPIHNYPSVGLYNACLTVYSTKTCPPETLCSSINVIVLSEDPTSPEPAFAPHIFPNPTTSHLTIRLGEPSRGPWRVTVHNALGQAILSEAFGAATEIGILDLSRISEGPYWVRIEMENGDGWVEKVEVVR